jgi:hypothetical protein
VTPENEQSCSFLGWCWQEEGPTLENKWLCSFSRDVGGGVGQRKVQPPKTSAMARFQGGRWVVVVVVVVEGSTCPKTSVRSRFRGSVGGGCNGGVNLPKNERSCSFSGAVVASERS